MLLQLRGNDSVDLPFVIHATLRYTCKFLPSDFITEHTKVGYVDGALNGNGAHRTQSFLSWNEAEPLVLKIDR